MNVGGALSELTAAVVMVNMPSVSLFAPVRNGPKSMRRLHDVQ
jgi:hypothetical protein